MGSLPYIALIDLIYNKTITITASPFTLGKPGERDHGVFNQSDLNYPNPHAEIFFSGTSWKIRDLNRLIGVWVNSSRISNEVILREDDHIGFF